MISEERNGNEGQKLAKLAKMHFWYHIFGTTKMMGHKMRILYGSIKVNQKMAFFGFEMWKPGI